VTGESFRWKTVTKKKEGLPQTDAISKREERARDGTKAMQEYEAEVLAIQERTARLRALRLAKEAETDEEAVQSIKRTAQRRTVRSTS
jgi:hypothetical protein